ncbi:MAG: polysaccharide biosynthesis protein [Verrucomicrobia bacterium]|nr:polysaccharide biosynthesis protein [Verrucomicrobiota bacterium]
MKQRTLLITGGTGSFGNAVLRRFLGDDSFGEIRILSRDEKKQDDMRRFYRNEKIKYYIGNTRDQRSVDTAMRGVDFVFQAAALKQVPSCEFFPMEAVHTNVTGCENVLESAMRHGIKSVVVLSTDKAVYPINAMGMSKALSEKIMVAKSRNLNGTGTTFCGTRYGNVMASRGSVIPLFVEQIKAGKPLSITDPSMTRFMMTLDDAVELVWFAFSNANNGDMFVQKAPAATVEVLALALKELYNASNPVAVIGTRHGEKLYETLVNREEMAMAEDLGGYFRIPADTRDLNYGKFFTEGETNVSQSEDYTSHNTHRLDVAGMKDLLLKLPMIRADILGEDIGHIYEP